MGDVDDQELLVHTHQELPVGVIGAGPAGLIVAHYLQENGVDFRVLEKLDGVGGVWRDPTNFYESMRTNIPAQSMAFRNIPFDWRVENKPTVNVVQDYLEEMMHSLQKEYFHFRTQVVSTEWKAQEEHWIVHCTTTKADSKSSQVFLFRSLIICTGHYHVPLLPSLKGSNVFPGQVIHSQQFHSAKDYRNQTVVVVGGLSSGSDIAAKLLPFAKAVHIVLRSDKSAPASVLEMMHQKAQKGGAIYHTGTAIQELCQDGSVQLDNGSLLPHVDVVLLATGFLYSYPFLPSNIQDDIMAQRDNDPVPCYRMRRLYKMVWYPLPTKTTTDDDNNKCNNSSECSRAALSFVGLPNGLLSPWILSEFQAKWIARVLSHKVSLPSTSQAMSQPDPICSSLFMGRDALWFQTGAYCNQIAMETWKTTENKDGIIPLKEGYWYGICTVHAWRILRAILYDKIRTVSLVNQLVTSKEKKSTTLPKKKSSAFSIMTIGVTGVALAFLFTQSSWRMQGFLQLK